MAVSLFACANISAKFEDKQQNQIKVKLTLIFTQRRERDEALIMPYSVRERLYIGNISDAAEILQNGSDEITHILSLFSSASISFFSEWRSNIVIASKEIRKCVSDDPKEKVLYLVEFAGKELKFVRMAVPLRDMESENLLDCLNVCLDFIDESRKEGGSVLVHCFAGVSRSFVNLEKWG
ncbi:hypothetical protein GIB67_000608 [Kingdonia uniflora]|uniref:protein-tyrosine-phosphatase n=1 Tax=Kingdonia uniflora TaxID=39325 RepID=A0A7J7P767_9MAGN|nr:hypothetical protein GIB67_000608 [Kingdonia uniflora]